MAIEDQVSGGELDSGPARLDLDSYLSWMRVEEGRIIHLGCKLMPAGARIAAERLLELADEIERAA